MVLKGSTATKEGATKFLKPKRNVRGERKTKEHDRKLQAPQLFDIVVGNNKNANQLLINKVLVDMMKLMLRIYQEEI